MRRQLRQVVCDSCKFLTLKKHGKEPCYFCGVVGGFHEMPHSWDRSSCPQCNGSVLGDIGCQTCLKECRVKQLTRAQASERPPEDFDSRYDKVGNCLAELIPEWAVGSVKGCKCKDIRAKLNRWGSDGCEANIDWIVQKMKGQKKYLRGAMRKIPDAVAECGVRYLVKKAIKRSRQK